MNTLRSAFCVNGPCVGRFFPASGDRSTINIADPDNEEFDYHTYSLANNVDKTGTTDAIYRSSNPRPRDPFTNQRVPRGI